MSEPGNLGWKRNKVAVKDLQWCESFVAMCSCVLVGGCLLAFPFLQGDIINWASHKSVSPEVHGGGGDEDEDKSLQPCFFIYTISIKTAVMFASGAF